MSENSAIPYQELVFKMSRSSGPGGQNVNKVNSKVQLRWNVWESSFLQGARRARFLELFSRKLLSDGTLVIQSEASRDQNRNKRECIERLGEMLAAASRPKKIRKATKPSKRAKEKRLVSKRKASDRKRLRGKVRNEGD